VHREQLKNENHYDQLTTNEISRCLHDINDFNKQCNEIKGRTDNAQGISQILRRVEYLRSSLGGEQGSLEEWKTVLQRGEADVKTFIDFNKEDNLQIHVIICFETQGCSELIEIFFFQIGFGNQTSKFKTRT